MRKRLEGQIPRQAWAGRGGEADGGPEIVTVCRACRVDLFLARIWPD